MKRRSNNMFSNDTASSDESLFSNAGYNQVRLHILFMDLVNHERNNDLHGLYKTYRSLYKELSPAFSDEEQGFVEGLLSDAHEHMSTPPGNPAEAIDCLDEADKLIRAVANKKKLYFKLGSDFSSVTGGGV